MKKFFFFTCLIAVMFFVNACTPHVSVRPSHMDVVRPISPSNNHVWVDGNWVYSRRTHAYTRKNGYWSMPNRGRAYKQGQWKTTRRGEHWIQGRWE